VQPPGTSLLFYAAPSRDLLAWAREEGDSEETWAQYREDYLDEQRGEYSRRPDRYAALVGRARDEGLALVCYCPTEEWPPDTHCHRIILADEVLVPVAESMNIQLRVEHL